MTASQASLRGTTGQTETHDEFCENKLNRHSARRQDFFEEHGPRRLGSHDHLQTFYSHSGDAFYIENWRRAVRRSAIRLAKGVQPQIHHLGFAERV